MGVGSYTEKPFLCIAYNHIGPSKLGVGAYSGDYSVCMLCEGFMHIIHTNALGVVECSGDRSEEERMIVTRPTVHPTA